MIQALIEIVGKDYVLTSSEDKEFYGKDRLKGTTPNPLAIVKPKTIEEVQKVVLLCHDQKIAIVPSGGRTGYAGGALAMNGEVVLSLERMNRILSVNQIDRTIITEPGVFLSQIHDAAKGVGLYYPVDLSSRGSCHIGGTIATNAGGIRVIRYGLTRDWVLGLKVVLANGELMTINGSLYKNQTGYDLRQLFIGSEGTLGIIVEATLKLTVPSKPGTVVLFGTDSTDSILKLLDLSKKYSLSLLAFETFDTESINLVITNAKLKNPWKQGYPAYALIEVETFDNTTNEIELFFEDAIKLGIVKDALLATNETQYKTFWSYRELISEVISKHEYPHKNDISVPVSNLPQFIEQAQITLKKHYPTFRMAIFGHIGDGNLHINILKPNDLKIFDFHTECKKVDEHLFSLVKKFNGSISAEHGIGVQKRDFLHYSRSETEISLMRSIKKVMDPDRILNPGKMLS